MQRRAGLVELAEQHADPAQVVLLALQLLVGQRGTDAGSADQQGDEADAQRQLQAVVARGQAQGGVGRDDQGHGRHRGEVGGDDTAGHQQAGAVLHGLVQGTAAMPEVAGQVQRGQAGEQGNGGRGQQQAGLVVLAGAGFQGGHAYEVHHDDTQADQYRTLQVMVCAHLAAVEAVHGQPGDGQGDEQRKDGQ
ncbi:hypothetical protein D3C75_845350 [compost metagenome]